jgi:hypothetical protein
VFTVRGRRADAVVVALAVAGIILLTVAWAATAGNGEAAGSNGDTLLGAEVIPNVPRTRTEPAFAEDFESGLRQWPEVGSAVTTDLTAAEGRRSAVLTSTACHGDALSRRIPVEAGSTYRLRTDYRTEGDGGYIGVDLFDADDTEVGEQWLIGDGGFPTYAEARWRYNVDDRDSDDLGSWARYSTRYVVPDGIASVAVKIEDWGCGGLPDDPSTAPVYFDRILLTPVR